MDPTLVWLVWGFFYKMKVVFKLKKSSACSYAVTTIKSHFNLLLGKQNELKYLDSLIIRQFFLSSNNYHSSVLNPFICCHPFFKIVHFCGKDLIILICITVLLLLNITFPILLHGSFCELSQRSEECRN